MRESSKEFPWVSIWMIAFSAIGIWLAWPPREHHDWYHATQAIVPLAAVFVAGFFGLPSGLYYESDGDRRPTMNDLGRLYLDALKQVFRQKWLLLFFSSIVALSVLAGFIDSRMIEDTIDLDGTMIAVGPKFSIPTDIEVWRSILAIQLPSAVAGSLGEFLPSTGLGSTGLAAGVLPVIGVLALVILFSILLPRLGDDRRYRVMRCAIAPAAVASVSVLAVAYLQYKTLVLQKPGFGSNTAFFFAALAGGILGALVHALFVGALIAGVGGSLLRSKQGESVTTASFVRDMVRLVMPVAGVYLLLTAIRLALSLPADISSLSSLLHPGVPSRSIVTVVRTVGHIMTVLYVLAMFAPFAVITRETGTWQGLKDSLRQWLARAGEAISFVALGISLMSVAYLVRNVVWAMTYQTIFLESAAPPTSVRVVAMVVQTVLGVLTSAAMTVAVWEFYWRITQRTPDTAVSSAHDPGI